MCAAFKVPSFMLCFLHPSQFLFSSSPSSSKSGSLIIVILFAVVLMGHPPSSQHTFCMSFLLSEKLHVTLAHAGCLTCIPFLKLWVTSLTPPELLGQGQVLAPRPPSPCSFPTVMALVLFYCDDSPALTQTELS